MYMKHYEKARKAQKSQQPPHLQVRKLILHLEWNPVSGIYASLATNNPISPNKPIA